MGTTAWGNTVEFVVPEDSPRFADLTPGSGLAGAAGPHFQLAGGEAPGGTLGVAAVANRVNTARFIPPVDSVATGMHVHCSIAATADDACDFGIFGVDPSNGEFIRLCSTGAVTGRMNTTLTPDTVNLKKQPIAIPRTSLEGGTPYHAAHSYGTNGGTIATLRGANRSIEGMLDLGMSMVVPAQVPFTFAATSHPIPATLAAPTQQSAGPVIGVSYARRVVCIGDSIFNVNGPNACAPRTLQALLGPHALVLNAGVASDTIALVNARIAADCHAHLPYEVVLNIGVNDVNADRSSAAIITDLGAMFADIVANGGLPRPNTILPYGGFGGWTAARETVRQAVNTWIREGDYPYTDTETMSNGDTVQPALQAGLTTDFIHPNAAGDRFLGRLIFDQAFGGRRTARL